MINSVTKHKGIKLSAITVAICLVALFALYFGRTTFFASADEQAAQADTDAYVTYLPNSYAYFNREPGVEPLCLTLNYVGVDYNPVALSYIEKTSNILDKVYLKFEDLYGRLARYNGEWMSLRDLRAIDNSNTPNIGVDGRYIMERVDTYGATIIFRLESNDFPKDKVTHIKIEEGLQMVTYSEDNFSYAPEIDPSEYYEIEGAVFRHDVILKKQKQGTVYTWQRKIAEENAVQILQDATKKTYIVGESVDLDGMKIIMHYADGFSEEILPTANNISRPQNGIFGENDVGDYTVRVVVNGQPIEYTVIVSATKENKPDKGGCGSIVEGTASIGMATCALAVSAISVLLSIRRKRRTDIDFVDTTIR